MANASPWLRLCLLLLGSVVGGLYAGNFVRADDVSEPTSDTAARWGVPPEFISETVNAIHPKWQRRLVGYIVARDGVQLRYSALLPKGRGPFPVIINYSGYDPGAIADCRTYTTTLLCRPLLTPCCSNMAMRVDVNARGTGCSHGVFDFLGPSYGTDGADAVEWAAAQTWSNGAVGMANWSWAGMSQLATASEQPAHLKAIAPGMALTDPRLDSWALGGMPSPGFITGWWIFLHSRWLAVRHSAEDEHDRECLAQVERNYQSGQDPQVSLPTNLVRHPQRDAWIERRTILDKVNRIDVPVLSMEAFQDEATTVRAGYYHERLNPKNLWLVQSNGNHDLYDSRQFQPTLLAFLGHFVKGIDNGFERRPHVEVWQETATDGTLVDRNRDSNATAGWVYTRVNLPVPVVTTELRLVDDRRLALPGESVAVAAQSAQDRYQYPVEGPSVNVNPNASAWGEAASGWQHGSLEYTSAPLQQSIVMYVPASADLWISATESDVDVQVTLSEIRSDGQEVFVQRGWLRLSNRRQDPQHSTGLRPWPCDTPECVETLVPDLPVLARVEIFKAGYAFRKGSRIRVWLDAPSATGSNSFNHSRLPATISVWRDASHASKLVLGTLADIHVPERAPVCGSVLMQPCRNDPLAGVGGM